MRISTQYATFLSLVLAVSLLIGCSTQTQSFWRTIRGDSTVVESTPANSKPLSLRPVRHGWHIAAGEKALTSNKVKNQGWHVVNIQDKPRLKNKIGAAAVPDVKFVVNHVTGFKLKNEAFIVYVPSTYTDDVPHGFWFSQSGGSDSWSSVCDERKLIMIRPLEWLHKLVPHKRRVRLALEARKYALLNYNIDPNRIYISSYLSRGCSAVLTSYPDVFNGSIHMHEDRPEIFELHIPMRRPINIERVVNKLKIKNRFVCIGWHYDVPYYKLKKDAYFQLKKRGIKAVFIEDREGRIVRDKKYIIQALDFLDRPR